MKDEEIYDKLGNYFDSLGYAFERDKDGFWFEDYVSDKKWKEQFEEMYTFARKAFLAAREMKTHDLKYKYDGYDGWVKTL